MVDFKQQLEALQNALTDNIGTGKDSVKEIKKKITPHTTQSIEIIDTAKESSLEILEKSINNIEEESPYSDSVIKEIEHLKERIGELEKKFKQQEETVTIENIQKESSAESKLFIEMLDIYLYSIIINPKLKFTTKLYQQYKENLTLISQNILANSFRFFEKDSILINTIQLGIDIQKTYNIEKDSFNKIQNILQDMQNSLSKPSYQKNLYFAKILNERGLILNTVAMVNEILGEYIIASAQNLSINANERIQFHLNRIDSSQTSRRAYYHFYKSVTNFFYTHFNTQTNEQETTFFPYKDTGNDEIEMQFRRMFQSNKRRKGNLFSLYSEMIYRIRVIRNDLVHGNNQRHYHNISYEVEDVLIDFEYLAIQKDFLGASSL